MILFSFLLISCGGGGGSSSSNFTFVEVNARELYSGQVSQATLTKDNGMEFVEAVLNNYTIDLGGSTNLSGRPTNTNVNNNIQAREVSETIPCDFGGSIDANGDLNEQTLLGILNLDINQCNNDGISTLTGMISMKINGFDVQSEAITSSVISMNNLMLQFQGETQSVSGTETYDLERPVETTVSNTIRLNTDGKQSLTENLTLKETFGGAFFEGNGNEISGKIYLEDHGYVQISTTELLEDNLGIPSLGEILVVGANQSKLIITAISGFNNVFRVRLDSEGDGIYEAFSTITSFNSIPLTFEDNLPPVIEASSNNDPLNVSSVYNIDANNLIDGNDFYLSFYGTDPEFNVVTLEASLISKPSGSITTLNLHPLSFSFPDSYFITPDLAGEYIIEVLATDGDGVSAIRNYTINASFN